MIYKKIVKVICLSFALILMIGVCGCMESKYPSFTNNELSEYLKKKYGAEFTFLEPMNDRQPETYSYSAYFACPELSNKRILAKVYVADESNEKLYADNYYSILYEEETRTILEKIANSVYPDSKCIYEIDDTTVSLYPEMNSVSIDDYLMSSTSGLYLTIILPANHDLQNKETEADLLAKSLIEQKIVCTCKVIYTNSEEDFNSFDSDPQTTLVDNRATGYIYINDDLVVRKIEWR